MKSWIVVLLAGVVAVNALGQTGPSKKKKGSQASKAAINQSRPVAASSQALEAAVTDPSAIAALSRTNGTVKAAPEPKSTDQDGRKEQRIINFQKQRALSGSESAQYDLGMRYLNGDGVTKSLPEARKWLEMSAKQGNTMAIQKLEQLKSNK